MNFNFLSPVSELVLAHNELLPQQALGRRLRIHSQQNGIPDLEGVDLAILGVIENRNDINYIGEDFNLNEINGGSIELICAKKNNGGVKPLRQFFLHDR